MISIPTEVKIELDLTEIIFETVSVELGDTDIADEVNVISFDVIGNITGLFMFIIDEPNTILFVGVLIFVGPEVYDVLMLVICIISVDAAALEIFISMVVGTYDSNELDNIFDGTSR